MRPGDIVFTTHIQQRVPGMLMQLRAKKGEQFVFVFLGVESKDSFDFDAKKALEELGWYQELDKSE